MFEKNLKLAFLLDFYGEVLDEHTHSVMNAYYNDDLSLAEIADGIGISRQGVRHIIKKGEEQLEFLEEKLGLASHHRELADMAGQLEDLQRKLKGLGCDEEDISIIHRASRLMLRQE